METAITQYYKIARVSDEGQQVVVSWLGDLNEAKQLVLSLNEFWPRRYTVLEPDLQLGGESTAREIPVGPPPV